MKQFRGYLPEVLLKSIDEWVTTSEHKKRSTFIRYCVEKVYLEEGVNNSFSEEWVTDKHIDTLLFTGNFWGKFHHDTRQWSMKRKIQYLKYWKNKVMCQVIRTGDKEVIREKGVLIKEINKKMTFFRRQKKGKTKYEKY